MFLPLNNNQIAFDDGPSSPIGRKGISMANPNSFSTPKSKYKSVEKHAHELINTPKPSSKKKALFTSFEKTSDLPSFDDEAQGIPQPLNIHRQLSTISENFDDDKENNQNYMNQYQYNHKNQNLGTPEKHIKRLNLADQQNQNDQFRSQENTFDYQVNNIFQAIKENNSFLNNNNNNQQQNIFQSNKLIEFFSMFNLQNEQIQSVFDLNAQFEIINSGFSSNVTENIMQLTQTFNFFQVDLNSIEVFQQEDIFITNLRGIAFGFSVNPMNFIASAKINYNTNLINHIRIQFL